METLSNVNSRPWGDLLYDEEQNRKMALLRMPEPEWLACVNAYFNRLRGNGSALISALAWATQVAAERTAFRAPATPAPEMDEDTRNWRVWKDMVEEPYKYGTDIGEWTALDEEVRRGPKRWRVDAFWNTVVREIEEEQTFAATRIQALWRGHVARTVMGERFNCGRCLRHIACPARLEEDDIYVCRECKLEWDAAWRALGDELEAEGVRSCDDCEEDVIVYGAPVGDFYLCAECVHDWMPCPRDNCRSLVRVGATCDNHCRNCGDSLEHATTTLGYCSFDCQYEWQQDNID